MQTTIETARSEGLKTTRSRCVQVLTEAHDRVAAAAVIHVQSGVEIPARFTEIGPCHIRMVLESNVHGVDAFAPDDRLRIRVAVSSGCFEFETNIVEVNRSAAGRSELRLQFPEKMQCLRRRQFRRAMVRPSTAVTLVRPGRTDAYRADMLNISADGFACRLGARDAEMLRTGERLSTTFHLDTDDELFTLDAELKGKTPAGSPERTILRLQFISESMPDETRVRLCHMTQAWREPA